MSKTEKMHTYKSFVSLDLVLRNSCYLLLLGILAMLGVACLSFTACAEEVSSSVHVQKGDSSVIQGDPFAVEGDSFDSLIEESPELSTLDDENEFALGGYLESRNQLSLVHFAEPISLRQRLRLEGDGNVTSFLPLSVLMPISKQQPIPGKGRTGQSLLSSKSIT